MPRRPISFAIREEYILSDVPEKTKVFSSSMPNDRVFTDQNEYYAEYRRALFGVTRLKAGWDCLRHYEILANGCIPYFENLDGIPTKTLIDFPREIVRRAMKKYDTDKANGVSDETMLHDAEYKEIIKELLVWTRKYLTTKERVKYIVNTILGSIYISRSNLGSGSGLLLDENVDNMDNVDNMNNVVGSDNNAWTRIKKILWIGISPGPDYLRDLVLHGFKSVYGSENVIDIVRAPHLYDDYPVEALKNIAACGFTYTRGIHEEPGSCNRENILERIREHEFDIVVYGSMHTGMLYREEVEKYYKTSEVAFLCGDDANCSSAMDRCPCSKRDDPIERFVFIRELVDSLCSKFIN